MVRSDEDLLVIRVKREESSEKEKNFPERFGQKKISYYLCSRNSKNRGSAKRGGAQVAKEAKEVESVSVTGLFLRRIWSEENKLLPLQSLPQRTGHPKGRKRSGTRDPSQEGG